MEDKIKKSEKLKKSDAPNVGGLENPTIGVGKDYGVIVMPLML